MPRSASGQMIVKDTRGGRTYALRFRAYGRREYVTLGTAEAGWTQARAETELENVLADVRRGIWRAPSAVSTAQAPRDPTFHEFSLEWFYAHRGEWRPGTQTDYQWQLSSHLLPFFHRHRLSEITIAEVDRYRNEKVRERMINATSINKTITRLAQILEIAVEYGMIASNLAKGRRRRLKASSPPPIWLDSADQIESLLNAAGELDRQDERRAGPPHRRAMLATLTFAGLRIDELIELRWRDIDLAHNRLTVRRAKTDAGIRTIDLLPALRDELAAHKAKTRLATPEELVFPTSSGRAHDASNIRTRILDASVDLANERRTARDETPLPEGLSPHKLRHTYASLLVALGVDPGAVMDQLGHSSVNFTLRVYRHAMRRTPASRRELATLVGAADWAPMGTGSLFAPEIDPTQRGPRTLKLADLQDLRQEPETGLEPVTLRLQGECSTS